MIPPHASAGSAERYPSAYGLSAAVCQALRAAFIPRRMRCLWAAGLAAALAANPYVLNDGQSLLRAAWASPAPHPCSAAPFFSA